MKRIISLVWVAMIMSALVLASALPALAAPPTFSTTCLYSNFGFFLVTNDPQSYSDVNASYKNCQKSGGAASREITPNPGPPTE